MWNRPADRALRTRAPSLVLWLAYALVAIGPLLTPTPALAQPGGASLCQSGMSAWLDRCSKQSNLTLRARSCPPGRVVVAVEPGEGARLDIEVRTRAAGAFRSVAGFGVSPVGQFADWSQEPAARRAAFEAFASCVRDDPSLPLASEPASQDSAAPPPTGPGTPLPLRRVPWMLLSAMIAVGASWWIRRRSFAADPGEPSTPPPKRDVADRIRELSRKPAWRRAAWLAGIGVACFAYRWFLLPRGFFHQNGQGPMWIRQAIDDAFGTSDYGPGYAEVFGWLVRAFPTTPDTAVFFTLAIVSASIPAMAWGLARRAGAHSSAAWALAILFAAHPLLGRLAQSESYFAVGLMLLFAGACALSTASFRTGLRDPSAWLAVLACGLLIAQAVRVHPVLWAPACAIPAVLLVRPGRWRRRALQTALLGLGVVVVVAATTGTTLLSILAGIRSHPLRPVEQLSIAPPGTLWWIALLGLAVVVCASRSRVRAALAVAVLVAGFFAIRATFILRPNYPLIAHAYLLLWAPALLPALLSLVRTATQRARRRRGWIQGAITLLAGTLVTVPWWSDYLRVPTDVREAEWAMQWRRQLGRGAAIVYLGRAGERIVALPILAADGHDELVMRSDEPPPRLPESSAVVYYYRSSLCSTQEGKAACEDFEKTVPLVPIEERDLPALGSHPWQPLGPGPVPVGLFRVGEAR